MGVLVTYKEPFRRNTVNNAYDLEIPDLVKANRVHDLLKRGSTVAGMFTLFFLLDLEAANRVDDVTDDDADGDTDSVDRSASVCWR